MSLRSILWLVLIVTCSSAFADTKSDAAVALKTIVEGDFSVLCEVTGDLTNDGFESIKGSRLN
ncbi:MAG: hypothetical protein IPL58_16430 [Betaproteobacteria bacterium]|uniref:Uncharacterized protein n=1 Tax=Candidatus Proximibacter danicus TaxID=2954365 RepID=A0A9D7K736_9PROT|nr:hypothetical protein [Candidatus Proximibacter danicus]